MSRRTLLALLAVLAFAAITASAALANGKGEIVNKEGKALVKNTFTGKSSIVSFFEEPEGNKNSCEAVSSFAGSFTSTTSGSATLTLTGCEWAVGGCKTAGKPAHELAIPLGLTMLSKEGRDYIQAAFGELDIKCGTVDVKIKGNVLIPAPSEGKLSTQYTFNLTGSKGSQTPEDTTSPLEVKWGGESYQKLSIDLPELVTTFAEEAEFL